MRESADQIKMYHYLKSFMKGCVLVQRQFRAMKKSKNTKRLLIYYLWDRYVNKHMKMANKVFVLGIKLKHEVGKLARTALLAELAEAPRSNLTLS